MSELNYEVAARLRAEADRGFPQAWIPEEPDDEIAGTITRIRPAVPTAYGPAIVVELEELGGPPSWSVWLIHTVLRREFLRQRPMPAERILIRYLGRVTPEGGGAAYEAYKLVVDRPDEGNEVDWAAIAARYNPDLAGGETRENERTTLGDEDVPY